MTDPGLASHPLALVTGASSGLGREFATQLAGRGHDLVIVARRRERLDDLAAEIRRSTAQTVTVIDLDLAEPGAAATLHAAVKALGLAPSLLVNNAGIGTDADVLACAPERLDQVIQLNIAALTGLSRLFGADMVAAGAGVILNVASLTAALPTPHMAVYGASKAYVLNFTQALAAELWGTGVAAITAMPSATRTGFADNGGVVPGPESMHADPAEVVAEILAALDRSKPPLVVVPGLANAVMAPLLSRLPRRFALRLLTRALR